MAGSIEFTPPYQDGWQDNEEGATPITADILNNNYDAFLLLLNTWIENTEKSLVAIPDSLTDLSGDVQISSPSNGQVLKFNGTKWVNAAESGGGSNVSWNQVLQSGTQIASITINGTSYTVYAPTPITNLNGLSDVTLVSPSNGHVLQYNSNTSKWENKSISVGDSVEFTQVLSSGVRIGTITIDGTAYDIYAPQGGGGSYEPNGVTYTIINNSTDETQSGQTARSIVVNKFEDNVQTDTGSLSYGTVVTTGPTNFTVGNVKTTYTLVSGTAYWVLTVVSGHIQYNGTLYETNDEILRTPVAGSSVITLTDIEEMEESHSTVVWTQTQQSGTKIAEISIDGASQNVYIPNIPANTSDLNNDSNFVADASYVHTDNNYTTTEKNKLADLNQVEANPSSGTSAGNLNSIEIGGTKYDIPSGGGGGTTVVANPSGTPTDELLAIQIGNDIYEIPQGGSGGGSSIPAYSTNETSYCAWIDGTTVYQKTFTVDGDDTTREFTVQTGITNGKRLINAQVAGLRWDSASRWWAPCYINIDNFSWSTHFSLNSDFSEFVVKAAQFPLKNITVTLYYTKTDDIPYHGGGGGYTEVTGTLVAGETSVSLSDRAINNNSTFDGPYTTVFGVNPTDMVVTTGNQVLQEFVTQESELSGTVTASSMFSSYPAWKAFLDSTVDGWVAEDSDTAPYLEYEFPSAVMVDEITWYTPGGIRESDLEKVQYSLDGTTWIDCTLSTNESNHVEIEDAETAQYWKMIFADGPYSQYMAPMVSKLQFISVGVGTLTLTFPSQQSDVGVKVRVS